MKADKKSVQAGLDQKSVAMYIRVSTEDQAESGLGLEAQKTRCFAMAVVKGLPVPGIYADEGISGTKDASKRPALARLLEDVRAGRVGTFIFLSLDRLGRDVMLILNLVAEFNKYGVDLISCKESMDTSTAVGKAMMHIMAVLAQLERDLTSERTIAALYELSKQGVTSGRTPLGYIRTAEGMIIHLENARIVQHIFKLRNDGLSLRAIAEELDTMCPSPLGGKWRHMTVLKILRNEDKYRGGILARSQNIWPAILA